MAREQQADQEGWYRQALNALEGRHNGSTQDVVRRFRRAALQRFETMGFPSQKHEDWKYTNISALKRGSFMPAVPVAESSEAGSKYADCFSEHIAKLVISNGRVKSEDLAELSLPEGVQIQSLQSVLANGNSAALREQLLKHFDRLHEQEFSPLSVLNSALLNDGLVILIGDNVVLEKPIIIQHRAEGSLSGRMQQLRHVVSLGTSSQAMIVETFDGPDDQLYYTNIVMSALVAENASLRHIRLQHEGASAIHTATTFIDQQRDSRLMSMHVQFGAALVRNEIFPRLLGEGIDCKLFGLNVLDKSQHVDTHTIMDHSEPNCTSTEIFKGVYSERSHGIFSGTIVVREDAQKTNAIQSNNNVLLSTEAAADSRPQLKIYADDVRCTHGSTTGQLDENALFYLRSRGIGLNQAKKILVKAFAAEVLEQLNSEVLVEAVRGQVFAKLDDDIERTESE